MGNNPGKCDDTVDHQPADHIELTTKNVSLRSCTNSVTSSSSSHRPWSRISRRRWKKSTLTLPYELSKTAWPVTQLEAFFLPDFPVDACGTTKYQILDELNHGAFGKVYKVQFKGEHFALKVLSKARIIQEDCVRQVKDEIRIQGACGHHPFVVELVKFWQDKRKLYVLSQFVQEGELFALLQNCGGFSKKLTRIYVAQIALTLDFLHNAGVIFRDLKPENILLDQDGNIQIVDFGLAKWLGYGQRTRTFCGTFLYMAPEVLKLEPYGHAVDWWSLGVIACLMCTNKHPSKPAGTLPEDHNLDVPTKDLLLRLLQPDPAKRLRSLRTLKTIPFYKDFNFEELLQKKIVPKDMWPAPQAISDEIFV